jgi:Spy/CpxP family protein refolding chaperone
MNARTFTPAVSIVLCLGLGPLGCDHKSSGGDTTSPSTSASAAPSASASSAAASASASAAAFAMKGRSRHHVGVAGALLRGAYEFSLDDAQRATLEKAEDALYPDKATSPWAAIKVFNSDLVAGIRAAKLDQAKITADYAAIDKALTEGEAREADALDQLHAALTPAQRQELANQVKARHAPRHPLAAPDAGGLDMTKNRLVRLTAQLTLDDAQQKSVGALLAKDTTMTFATIQAKREAAQKQLDGLLDAFAKDPFDAKKLELGAPGAKTPHDAMEHHAQFIAALMPLLHPDQREKLAVQTERQGSRPTHYFEESEPAAPGE